MGDVFYWSMVAVLFTHELDAVRRHEWRVLPLTRTFPDKLGEQLFIWAHAPLFLAIFWFSRAGAAGTLPLGLSAFAIVHVALHWQFRNHPAYEFNNAGSWTLIVGAGMLGALHLITVAAT